MAVTVIQFVEYCITVPGLGSPIFLKVPIGSPPPVVTASPCVVATTPVVPLVQVPPRIPAKTPCEVRIAGVPKTVAACVANVLKLIAGGAKEVELRPESLLKFQRDISEIKLTRDVGRKVVSNRAWYFVS